MDLRAESKAYLERWGGDLNGKLILGGFTGSLTYGTSVDTGEFSDIDLMGVFVLPLENYIGLPNSGYKETIRINDPPYDVVLYETRKMLGMLENANPNVLIQLWNRPEDMLFVTPEGRLLIDNRDLFLSKKVAQTFAGYAAGQLAKMKASIGQDVSTGDLGEKRKMLVEKYGFDTKNAAHLLRLLRMGEEILSTGEVNVWRGGIDADELQAVRNGEWSIDRISEEAERRFGLYQVSKEKSSLPEVADREKVNDLCLRIMRMSLKI